MQFRVPQFIEVEDRIFGPLTWKQFIYVAGGVGFFVMLYVLLPLFFAIILGGPMVAFALALAFYKVNDRPFIDVVESAVGYSMKGKLYLWKKEPKKTEMKPEEKLAGIAPYVPKESENKLKDLAWELDIKESIYGDRSQ